LEGIAMPFKSKAQRGKSCAMADRGEKAKEKGKKGKKLPPWLRTRRVN